MPQGNERDDQTDSLRHRPGQPEAGAAPEGGEAVEAGGEHHEGADHAQAKRNAAVGKGSEHAGGKDVDANKDAGGQGNQQSVFRNVEELRPLAFTCRKRFELYHEGKLHFFYPKEDPVQVARWALIVDMLKNGFKTDAIKIQTNID